MSDRQRARAGVGSSNVIRTLLRHEELLDAWLGLGGKLLFSEHLLPRERELVVLRVARRTSCAYAWGGHAVAALAAGITSAEMRAILDDSAAWSASDAALLRAVDELCSDNYVTDPTWAALTATRDDSQVIEVLLLTGFYRMNAGMLNSVGVQPDAGMPAFGEVPEVPASQPPTPVPVDAGPGFGEVAGAWQVIFHHPTGDQHLTLDLSVVDGLVSGSVSNHAAGITIPITAGQADGSRFSFAAPMTTPMQLNITYEGVVRGDAIAGQVVITGAGTFPFEGARAQLSAANSA